MTQGFIEGVSGFLTSDYVAKTANYQLVGGDKVIAEHATPATRLTFTLPATCPVGAILAVATGLNTGGFRLAQNTGQSVLIDGQVATVGASGYWDSDSADCALLLRCTQADTKFEAVAFVGRVKTDTSAYRGTAEAATAGTTARRGASGQVAVGAPQTSGDATRLADIGGSALSTAPSFRAGVTATVAVTDTANILNGGPLAARPGGKLWVIYKVTSGKPRVAYSTDDGVNWSTADLGLTTSEDPQTMSIYAVDDSNILISYGLSGATKVIKSTDGGANWSVFGTVSATQSATRTILAFVTGTTFYIAYTFGTEGSTRSTRFSTSTDGGATWSAVVTVGSDGSGGTHSLGMSVISASTIVIAHSYVSIFVSTNSGASFTQKFTTNISNSNGNAFVVTKDANNWLAIVITHAATNIAGYRTRDAGTTVDGNTTFKQGGTSDQHRILGQAAVVKVGSTFFIGIQHLAEGIHVWEGDGDSFSDGAVIGGYSPSNVAGCPALATDGTDLYLSVVDAVQKAVLVMKAKRMAVA